MTTVVGIWIWLQVIWGTVTFETNLYDFDYYLSLGGLTTTSTIPSIPVNT